MERPSEQYEDIQIRNLDTGDSFNLAGEFEKLQLDLHDKQIREQAGRPVSPLGLLMRTGT